MVSLYAFPVIFIDTVLFKKGALIKRAGVRTPWTPALDPPLKWGGFCTMNLFPHIPTADLCYNSDA